MSEFHGAYVALVTPFRDGRFDEKAMAALIEWQLGQGVSGFVPCGTTGESATLTHEEHAEVIKSVVGIVRRRSKVVAGTGSNSTAEAIALTRQAEKAGADGALLIAPYYNKPTQAGLLAHFRAVAEAVDIPQILYNIPGRTAVNVAAETIAELSHVPNIVGVKEATGSMETASWLVRHCRSGFAVLAGDDLMTLPILAVGGHGVISASANVLPGEFADLCRLMKEGRLEAAREIHLGLVDLVRALFNETNPIPVKKALELMGRIQPELRLPLTPMSAGPARVLADAMRVRGLIP